MPGPIRSALHAAGYRSVRQLAMSLLAEHPAVFARPPGYDHRASKSPSSALEILLARLNEGRDLVWWKKRRHAAELVARKLCIEASAFNLDREPGSHLFIFDSFPALPALDLSVEERYSIARPVLVNGGQTQSDTWRNLEYWFSGEGSNRNAQQLEWLQVADETEFELITKHLVASSRHMTVLVPAQAGDEYAKALRHRSPLILALQERVGPPMLAFLKERATQAPLLVISPYSFSDIEAYVSTQGERTPTDPPTPNAWRWTFHNDWRRILLRWVAKRLTEHKITPMFVPDDLTQWLHDVDPEHHWFARPSDVLWLCRVAHEESAETLRDIKNYQNGRELVSRIFHLAPIQRKQLSQLEEAVMLRWRDWGHAWDSDLEPDEWIQAGVQRSRLDKLLGAGLLVAGTVGYRFADRMLARFLLRRALDRQVRMDPPDRWWPACFDPDRRVLLDATVASMSMHQLGVAAFKQKKPSSNASEEHLAGPAEVLFVAIGKHLSRGAAPPKSVHVVGEIILERFGRNGDIPRPWSRPCTTLKETFQWTSSMWAWSLVTQPAPGTAPSWSMPGWNDELPADYPDWLNPRSGFHHGEQPMSPLSELTYFLDVSHLCMKRLRQLPSEPVPMLLKPAMVSAVIGGTWSMNPWWWSGLIGQDWAEASLMSRFGDIAPERRAVVARKLWPSLVQWQRLRLEGRGRTFSRKGELLLPSCREESQDFSRVMQWVAGHLDDADVLEPLVEEDRVFIEEHPQWLLSQHKLLVLRSLADRLPLALQRFETQGYFFAFLPDAAKGLRWFLHDEDLGEQASHGLWSWAPDLAVDILSHPGEHDAQVCRQLIRVCPVAHLGAALAALRCIPSLLPDDYRNEWVQFHLPNAGQHAMELFTMLRR